MLPLCSKNASIMPTPAAVSALFCLHLQGIGRALLRRCIWLSRQEASIGAVYLHVITTNPPAHRFYESEGFVQVCCITGERALGYIYVTDNRGAILPTDSSYGRFSENVTRNYGISAFGVRALSDPPPLKPPPLPSLPLSRPSPPPSLRLLQDQRSAVRLLPVRVVHQRSPASG